MAKPSASAETDPTRVSVDPQNPLPESNWLWRRVMVFTGFGAFVGLIIFAVILIGQLGRDNPLSAINALTYTIYCLAGLLALDRGLYMVAPSAEQFGGWMQTVSAWKSGISFASSSTAETPEGRVTSEQSSGPAAPPAAPAPTPEKPLAPSDPVRRESPPDPAPTEGVGIDPRNVGSE